MFTWSIFKVWLVHKSTLFGYPSIAWFDLWLGFIMKQKCVRNLSISFTLIMISKLFIFGSASSMFHSLNLHCDQPWENNEEEFYGWGPHHKNKCARLEILNKSMKLWGSRSLLKRSWTKLQNVIWTLKVSLCKLSYNKLHFLPSSTQYLQGRPLNSGDFDTTSFWIHIAASSMFQHKQTTGFIERSRFIQK